MNRRKFLTLSATAPFLRPPQLDVSAPADLPALLRPFVLRGGDTEFRAPLREVFSIDGWLVATDGRVCVRGRDRWARRKSDKPPTAENLNWAGPWGPGFRLAEFPHEAEFVPCGVCGRTGPFPVSEHMWWCCSCEGEGVENHRAGDLPEDLGGLRLRLRYVQQIMKLPGVIWHTALVIAHNISPVGWDIPDGPVRFTWDGGDGLLMPMVKREDTPADVLLRAVWRGGTNNRTRA
jgi:hypothetical protein